MLLPTIITFGEVRSLICSSRGFSAGDGDGARYIRAARGASLVRCYRSAHLPCNLELTRQESRCLAFWPTDRSLQQLKTGEGPISYLLARPSISDARRRARLLRSSSAIWLFSSISCSLGSQSVKSSRVVTKQNKNKNRVVRKHFSWLSSHLEVGQNGEGLRRLLAPSLFLVLQYAKSQQLIFTADDTDSSNRSTSIFYLPLFFSLGTYG